MDQRPSATAWRVAQRRAAHQILDEPRVLEDPLALRIIGEKAAEAIRSGADGRGQSRFARYLRAFLVARSRYAEDALAAAVEKGIRQYVILGAGLDTSAYRNRLGGFLRTFEVDHPATQGWKRETLARTGIPIPDFLTFVPLDFESQTLPEGLRTAGFDPAQPAFFSWLGVVPYLRREAILTTLGFVGSLPPGTAIAFDYGLPPSSLGFLPRLVYGLLARRVARAGEPFRTFFEPSELAAVLRGTGFRRVEDLGAGEINARYFAGRNDGLRVGTAGRLVSATV
jgi:methyltransferase (TIGR00027 family)